MAALPEPVSWLMWAGQAKWDGRSCFSLWCESITVLWYRTEGESRYSYPSAFWVPEIVSWVGSVFRGNELFLKVVILIIEGNGTWNSDTRKFLLICAVGQAGCCEGCTSPQQWLSLQVRTAFLAVAAKRSVTPSSAPATWPSGNVTPTCV